jgi:hypothetical protein
VFLRNFGDANGRDTKSIRVRLMCEQKRNFGVSHGRETCSGNVSRSRNEADTVSLRETFVKWARAAIPRAADE